MASANNGPNLDEFLESARQWSGEHLTRAQKFMLLLAAAAVFSGFSSWFTVQPEETAVVLRFGRVARTVGPGLNFKLPLGIETVRLVPTARIFKQEFGFRAATGGLPPDQGPGDYAEESLVLTGDLNVIDVQWIVQYQVQDPIQYLFQVRDPEETLRNFSESVMQRVVGNRLASEVLTLGRVAVAAEAKEELQQLLTAYATGIRLVTVELQDVTPPGPVRAAFNEVNEARQDRERMINMAQEQTNKLIPRARGEAAQAVAEAEGYAIQRVNEAHGDTSRFLAVLQEYRQAREVTRKRLYLEAMRDVSRSARAVYVVDSEQKAMVPWLALDSSAASRVATEGGK